MTQTVDKKVVEMAFENNKFESGVGTSLSTIDKLKKALNFDGVGKGLGAISSAADKVNLGGLASGVDHISSRFSALGIVAVTTLVNIANSAYQAGAQIVKALTVDPIKAGLDEYETKLNSVQTILANTQKEGTNLAQVTDALNQLNTYSDKTIYNFQQMARNVGTFTAAGVKLDASVAAIKGIANLAAVSGSNADQASTAMYQLSQALSTGTVRLMDWNSVVNAGMGGTVFQDAIKETARVHGVAVDQIIEEEGSFRDSLQKGWLTSEILTETLQKFTGDLNEDQLRTMGYSEDQIASIIKLGQTANDAATKVKTFSQLFSTLKEAAQSGWAQTWEIIIGNFEEAKSFLTDLNNWFGGILGASADARNRLLQGWKDLGGRTALINSFQNALNGVVAIVNQIKDAFREFFPPTTSQQLFNFTKNLENLTNKFKMAAEGSDKIKRIFRGIFALFDIGVMLVGAIVKALFGLDDVVGNLGSSLGDFLANAGDFIVNMRNSIKTSKIFEKVVNGIKNVLEPIAKGIGAFFLVIFGGFDKLKTLKIPTNLFGGLGKAVTPLEKIGKLFREIGEFISTAVEKFGPILADFIGKAADFVTTGVEKATTAIEKFDPKNALALISGGILATILLEIKKFVGKGSAILESVAGIFDAVRDSLKTWQSSLKSDILLKIAAAIGIIAASLLVLSLIDKEKLIGALSGLTLAFGELVAALLILNKSSFDFGKMTAVSIGLIGLSTAMLIFGAAAKKFEDVGVDGLISMALALGVLGLAVKVMPPKMVEAGIEMILLADGLLILSKALRAMGDLSLEQLGNAIIAISASLAILAIGMTAMTGTIAGSFALLVAAGALLALAPAMKIMGALSWEAIGKGLLLIAGVLTVLGLAGLVLTPVVPTLLGLGVAMGIIGVAALGAGVGMLAFSTGLAALATIGAAGVAAITLVLTGLLVLLPQFGTQVANALANFVVAIADNSVKVRKAMTTLIISMLQSFTEAIPQLVDTIYAFIQSMLETIDKRLPAIEQAGFNILIKFLKGIHNNIEDIVIVAVGIIKTFLDTIAQELPVVNKAGWNLIISFIDTMADSAEQNIPELMAAVERLGISIVKGVINGIFSARSEAINAVKELGLSILQSFQETLGIHSPSKAFYDQAKFIPEGTAKGIEANAEIAYTKVRSFGEKLKSTFSTAVSQISEGLDTNMEFNPTIRPVVDMSDILDKNNQIKDVLGANKQLDLTAATISAQKISKTGSLSEDKDVSQQTGKTTSVTFNQINNSPKALSRIEIYRQTKNQLTQVKNMVGG